MVDNLDEKRRFAGLLTVLSDYYKSEISKGVMGLYWEGLKQYDYEAIEKAAWSHTQSPDEAGRWMPRISDLTKMLQGSTKDQASLAWSKVDRAIRTIGTYTDVAFDDAIIHRVLQDMGGWVLVGSKDNDEWPFVAKDFENRYRAYKMRDEQPEYPRKMIGISSAQNSSAGIQMNLGTVLIGDEQKAIAVIKGGSTNVSLSFNRVESPKLEAP